MSRLTSLLRQVEQYEPHLAADLKREVDALAGRRAFGLNFERHIPETVDLPGRPIRRGDKVRLRTPRGEIPKSADRRLFRVVRTHEANGRREATLLPVSEKPSDAISRPLEDLVVVAEFRDPIYPGLASTGKVERGGDKPFHTVINSENYHALQTLLYTHEGKVDAIYIDPPYNKGKRDWKYNNDYVDKDDAYRHSKWLAMMERRLKLATGLLRPDASALIVAIDEKEVHHLALLLEQLFDANRIQMITTVIYPKGDDTKGRFSRVEEHLFVVFLGDMTVTRWVSNMLDRPDGDKNDTTGIEWRGLRRSNASDVRGPTNPNQFYPVFVDLNTRQIHSIGDPIPLGADRHSVVPPKGTEAIWPLKPDGTEMRWGLIPKTLRNNWRRGFVRFSERRVVQYLMRGTIKAIDDGTITIIGRGQDGSVLGIRPSTRELKPKQVWNVGSHDAAVGGSRILSGLIPGHQFPYPKSLYAVEDVLRFFLAPRPDATVLDFFAGSGTTAHAVMRLNRQDGGRRKSILVTNNEVSAGETKRLRRDGLRPGDPEWERRGIVESVTKPRIEAAVTGVRPDGRTIEGDYRFTDEFPMSEGFRENVEFFSMTYEALRPVAHNRAFEAISPLLWMRAGSQGRRIEKAVEDYTVADTYGVLFDLDASRKFLSAVLQAPAVRMVFVVTEDQAAFQAVCRELPAKVEAVRLYESYLTNFTINTGQVGR